MRRFLLHTITIGVLFLLLTPLVVADGNLLPNSLFPYVVPKAVYARSVIAVVFGLWISLALLYPEYRPPKSWVLTIFAIHLAVGLIATVFSVSPQRSLWSTYERMQGMVDLVYWFVLSLVIASVFRTMSNWRMLLNANLGVSIVVALIGVAEHYGFEVLSYLTHAPRLKASLGNPNYLGAFTVLNGLIAVGFLADSFFSLKQVAVTTLGVKNRMRLSRENPNRVAKLEWDPAFRIYWSVAVFLNLWVFTMTASRGATLGLMAGILVFVSAYLWIGKVRVVRYVSAAILGFMVLVIVLLVLGRAMDWSDSLNSSNNLIGRLSSANISDGRTNSWKAGLQGFAERPLLGWGPENYTVAYDKHISAETFSGSAESFDQAHNKLLEEATTKGAIGFLTYCILWLVMTWAVVGRLRDRASPENLLIWFVGAALVSYFVQNLFSFDTPATILQFIILMTLTVHLETTLEKGWLAGNVERLLKRLTSSVPTTGLRSLLNCRVDSNYGIGLILVAGALVLAATSIYLFGFRVYNGATKVLQTTNPNLTWVQRLNLFEESIDSFDRLSNYPRIFMFNQLENNWQNLTINDAQIALEITEVQGEKAFSSEPREWRSFVSLANLYHRASLIGPKYADRSQKLIGASSDLIQSERLDTRGLNVSQILETDWSGVSDATILYLDLLRQSNDLFDEMFSRPDDRCDEMAPGRINSLLRLMEMTFIDAAAGDPHKWRVPVSFALTYGRASELEIVYLCLARSYIEQAKVFAPGRVEVYHALVRQYLAEGDPVAAYDVIEEYLQKSPGSDFYFEELRVEIESRINTSDSVPELP